MRLSSLSSVICCGGHLLRRPSTAVAINCDGYSWQKVKSSTVTVIHCGIQPLNGPLLWRLVIYCGSRADPGQKPLPCSYTIFYPPQTCVVATSAYSRHQQYDNIYIPLGTYTTRRGHTQAKGTYTRRGHTHGGRNRRRNTHDEKSHTEWTCTRRDVHMEGYIHGGELRIKEQSRKHTHEGDIHTG